MDEIIKLIKKKMVENGRDDFTNYLSEILDISKQWASVKLNGNSNFTDSELIRLNAELDFDADELKQALEVK